jgi:hypothetical protein
MSPPFSYRLRIERRSYVLLLVGSALFSSNPAYALDEATKSAARELARAGKRDFDRADFLEATRKFEIAFTAAPVPTIALWLARTKVRLGQLLAASDYYRKALALTSNELWIGDAQAQAQAQAQVELEQLLPRLSHLAVAVQQDNSVAFKVTIDGLAIPESELFASRSCDPGKHHVRVQVGNDTREEQIELKEGETRKVTFDFSEAKATAPMPPAAHDTDSSPKLRTSAPEFTIAPNSRPSPRVHESDSSGFRHAGFAALGVGVLGLTVGTTAGIVVWNRYTKYSGDCPDGHCDPSKIERSEVASYNHYQLASVIGFAAGAASTATGLLLLLAFDKHAESPQASIAITPNTATFTTRF